MKRTPPFELLKKAVEAESPDTALLYCDSILASDPRHLPALEVKARNLWRLGKYSSALQTIDEAIRINPFDPGYHFLRGDCLQQLVRFGEAVLAFERCLGAGDKALRVQAESRIADLEEWQEQLVAHLLKTDVLFRRQYDADPKQLLHAHGFRFSSVRLEQPLF